MTRQKIHNSYNLDRQLDQQGMRLSLGFQAGIKKNATGKKVENNSRLLKCKKVFLVSTLNRRTLSSRENMGELTASAGKYGIDTASIQEYQIFHDDIVIKHHYMKSK